MNSCSASSVSCTEAASACSRKENTALALIMDAIIMASIFVMLICIIISLCVSVQVIIGMIIISGIIIIGIITGIFKPRSVALKQAYC